MHLARATGDGIGSGKAAGEDGQEEKGSQMSKDERGWNSSLNEKPVHRRPRILEAPTQPDGCRQGPLEVVLTLHLRSCVFVKAACGTTARAVWAADGGQRASAPLRPDCPETRCDQKPNHFVYRLQTGSWYLLAPSSMPEHCSRSGVNMSQYETAASRAISACPSPYQ